MTRIKKASVKIKINAPASDVWKVIHDDFTNIGNYNPTLGEPKTCLKRLNWL